MDSPLRSLNCPNCGAPLDLEEGQALIRCEYCGSRIERSEEPPTPDDEGHALKVELVGSRVEVAQRSSARRFVIKMQGGRPMVIEAGDAAIPVQPAPTAASLSGSQVERRRPARASGTGCVGVGFILFFAVGIPLVAILSTIPNIGGLIRQLATGQVDEAVSNVSTLGARINVGRSAALVPALTDAPPDVLMVTTQYPASGEAEQRVVAVSGATPKLLWQSEPIARDLYDTPLLATADLVIVLSDKDRLRGLRREDGATLWEAPLADELSLNICRDCLQLADGRVFALSDDGTLQAFDAATGQPLWAFQAEQDSPRGLYLLRGRPAFMDRDDASEGLLHVFDPATGERTTVKPQCTVDNQRAEFADWTTRLHVLPDGGSFVLVYGSFEQCVDRRDAVTLAPIWTGRFAAGANSIYDEAPVVFGAGALYAAATGQVATVDLETGVARILTADEDYELAPLAAHEAGLLALARRTRGTPRFELWLINTLSGERRWTNQCALAGRPLRGPNQCHPRLRRSHQMTEAIPNHDPFPILK